MARFRVISIIDRYWHSVVHYVALVLPTSERFLTGRLGLIELFWIGSLLCVIFSDTLSDFTANAGLFATSLVVGCVLRRKLIAEANQRRAVFATAQTLEARNQALSNTNQKLRFDVAERTDILSFASHQLRSPLTVVLGYAELMHDRAADLATSRQKEIAGSLCEATRHLSRIAEDFLSAAKIEEGAMGYAMKVCDVATIASDVVSEVRPLAERKCFDLSFAMDEHDRYLVLGDAQKLREAFGALLDNAIQYTDEGAVHVSLTRDALSDAVVFAVADTGIGLSKESRKVIFQKWKRGGAGRIAAGGSGLGLYLAKKVITAHGGRIQVKSRGVGMGSTFLVRLPAKCH